MGKSVPAALVAFGIMLLLGGIFFFLVSEAYGSISGQAAAALPVFNQSNAWLLTLGGIAFIGLGIFLYMRR